MASLVFMASSERTPRLTPIHHEGPYLVSTVTNLPEGLEYIGNPTIIKLLDILEQYGLTKNFGVNVLHKHFPLDDGEVLYETDDVSSNITIGKFSDIKRNSAPHNYYIAQTSDGPQLFPLDYGPINPNVKAARIALSQAVDKGFLPDFLAATSGKYIGIGLILNVYRAALAQGKVLFNRVHKNEAHKDPTFYSDFEVIDNHTTSFYTRGIASSKSLEQVVECDSCPFP
jgi:hypothetical protein